MELLPCPFCDSNELTENGSFVECDGCFCQALKVRWNRRLSQWISVKDRLPDTEIEVMVYHQKDEHFYDTNFALAFLANSGRWIMDHFCEACSVDHVTHWQPLPKPPQETE